MTPAEYLVFEVVGQREASFAVLLFTGAAAGADPAGVHQTPDGSDVALLEFLDGASDRDDAADDFVPGDAGIDRRHDLMPLVAHLMKV